jgi:hypothetical protein
MNSFKSYLVITIFLTNCYQSYINAQSPPGIPYQAIARTTSGEPYASGALQARFSLHEQTATGTVSYAETHGLQTDALGLFSTTFGAGTPITGTFAAINWGLTTKYLQVEIDFGNGWIDMGTQQLMSVPYAMYAGSASISSNQFIIGSGFSTISNSTFNGTLTESTNFCNSLEEAGYADWRLPTLEEIFNYTAVTGVDLNVMPFWTTTYSGTQFIYIEEDRIGFSPGNTPRLTKCVR